MHAISRIEPTYEDSLWVFAFKVCVPLLITTRAVRLHLQVASFGDLLNSRFIDSPMCVRINVWKNGDGLWQPRLAYTVMKEIVFEMLKQCKFGTYVVVNRCDLFRKKSCTVKIDRNRFTPHVAHIVLALMVWLVPRAWTLSIAMMTLMLLLIGGVCH